MQAAFRPEDRRAVEPLFAGFRGLHGILAAGLEGQGSLLTDHPLQPRCAVMTVGDFLVCGGVPGPSAAHLLREALRGEKRVWEACGSDDWLAVLGRVRRICRHPRWAFDAAQPEDAHLRNILSEPRGLTFVPLTGAWIGWCRAQAWARDFVACYRDDDDFMRRGLGVLALLDGDPVAGAGAYLACRQGCEVQVQTREDCQGRGYATLSAAAMILAAHERGMFAFWDAANAASARVAEKLGYRCLGAYPAAMVLPVARSIVI